VSGDRDGAVELYVVTFEADSGLVTPLGIAGQAPSWQPTLLDPTLAE
jgi:hypothetical protein